MKQPKPLPTEPPFLTLYTSTHLRPTALARNMASVGRQTAVERIEQLVFPDHVGYGLAGGLFGRIPWYATACRGSYVAFLSDDDVLASEHAVADLERFVRKYVSPPVVLVNVKKGEHVFPRSDFPLDEPEEGKIDLGSYVLRRDVFVAYKDAYGLRYSGDVDHARCLWQNGFMPKYAKDLLFAEGPLSNGVTECTL